MPLHEALDYPSCVAPDGDWYTKLVKHYNSGRTAQYDGVRAAKRRAAAELENAARAKRSCIRCVELW
jgi:hypothetical protein